MFKVQMYDGQYLYVEVEGMGLVQIKRDDDGIAVDIFSLQDESESVASTWAHINELKGEEE